MSPPAPGLVMREEINGSQSQEQPQAEDEEDEEEVTAAQGTIGRIGGTPTGPADPLAAGREEETWTVIARARAVPSSRPGSNVRRANARALVRGLLHGG